MIEQWGRGIEKILTLCKEAGHPEPEFIERMGCIMVQMYSKHPMKTLIEIKDEDEKNISILESRRKLILEFLNKHKEGVSFNEFVRKMDITERTLRRDLQALKKQGQIIDKGKGRRTVWVLVKNE